jgi:hypothetical protein
VGAGDGVRGYILLCGLSLSEAITKGRMTATLKRLDELGVTGRCTRYAGTHQTRHGYRARAHSRLTRLGRFGLQYCTVMWPKRPLGMPVESSLPRPGLALEKHPTVTQQWSLDVHHFSIDSHHFPAVWVHVHLLPSLHHFRQMVGTNNPLILPGNTFTGNLTRFVPQ